MAAAAVLARALALRRHSDAPRVVPARRRWSRATCRSRRRAAQTNDPAAGFQNMQAGSEEDFILNVGRRTFFPAGSAALDSVAKTTLDGQIAWLKQISAMACKAAGFCRRSRQRFAQVSSRKSAPTPSWPTWPPAASRRAACGPRATARTAWCATVPTRPARSRTAASSPICATSATRAGRRHVNRRCIA